VRTIEGFHPSSLGLAADPGGRRSRVLGDLEDPYGRAAPKDAGYRHDREGPGDMLGHIRAGLSQTLLWISVEKGAPVLGVWQRVDLLEHRDAAHSREIAPPLIGA
jgi:thiamine phosphate synthase YjbQ (UPF0047 family)